MTTDPPITLTRIPLTRLKAHPDNVRRRVEDLADLAKSIEGVGILEPLLVLPANDKGVHLIVAGHRRRAAAIKAKGVVDAPCVVRDLTRVEVIEAMLVENMQRADLDPIEEAKAYGRLVELEATVATIAGKVGRTAAHVKGRIALLQLPSAAHDLFLAGRVNLEQLAGMVKHTTDTDAMDAWLTEITKTQSDWWATERPAEWIRRHIEQRDLAAKRAALTSKVEAKGWRVHKLRGYTDGRYRLATLAEVTFLEHLKLPGGVRGHESERCHAVALEGMEGYGRPELHHLCTSPLRHTTKAKASDRSELQMDPGTYAKVPVRATRSASGEQGPPAKVKRAMRAARIEHAAGQLAKATVDDRFLTVVLAAMDSRAGAAREKAAQLLGLDTTASGYDAWHAFAADPANLHRAVIGLGLAVCMETDWMPRVHGEWLAWLTDTGYTPLEDEAPWLAKSLDLYRGSRAEAGDQPVDATPTEE